MVYDFITKYYFIKLKYNNKTLHFNKHNISTCNNIFNNQ